MRYSSYELMWLFFVVSFLGWGLETVHAAIKKKRFVNRGLVNGPFCIIYGVTAVANAVFLQELPIFWVFTGAMIQATVIEWSAGHILERVGHGKWWDYSGFKWNLDGYICLPASLLWGALGTVGVLWGNNLLTRLYQMVPRTAGIVILWIVLLLNLLDIAATLIVLTGEKQSVEKWKEVDNWFTALTMHLGDGIFTRVNRRIYTAHPMKEKTEAESKAEADCFAYGCSFYKIVLLFVIGSFLGDIVETIFCRVRAGIWMRRSSLVWGPFSIVWGFAIAAATVMLYRYRNHSDRFLFLMGTVLGGAYEYLCSVLSELVFGTVFWDYSAIPFNLGGRINLLYCFFWGIAAVVWFKHLYPWFSERIEKLPPKAGKIVTWCLIVFMSVNMAVSALALIRGDERSRRIEAGSSWQQVMDERFDDERLERIYPNMIRVSEK